MRLFFASLPCVALGWSSTGHEIIMAIAKTRISPGALRYVITHLGDGIDMMDGTSWADSDDANLRYPDSFDFHHSHTPYRNCSDFDMGRDCRNGRCLVTGIAESASIISDPTVPEITRKDHFKFLVHYMGDIHQPMHTGFAEDHGGVDIALSFPPGISLHEVWDYEILNRVMGGESGKNVVKLIDQQSVKLCEDKQYRESLWIGNIRYNPVNTSESLIEFASAIASETATTITCERAYRDLSGKFIETGDSLSRNYLRENGPVVVHQLTKAAIRTADLIEKLSSLYYSRKRLLKAANSLRPATAQDSTTPTVVDASTNRFATLLLEFDPEELLDSLSSESSFVVDITNRTSADEKPIPSRRRGPTLGNRVDVFEEVDMSRLVLSRSPDHEFFITYREFAEIFSRDSKYTPLIPRFLPLDYLLIEFDNGLIRLGIDRRVFGSNPTKELIVRCIAYLKGLRLETSTDYSVFLSSEGHDIDESKISEESGIVVPPHPNPNVEQVRRSLERMYLDHMRQVTERSRREGYTTVGDMCNIYYERIQTEKFRYFYKNVNFVIHPKTLKHPSRVTRLAAYAIQDDYYLVVDPLVLDGPLTEKIVSYLVSPRERSKTGKGFIKERGTESFMHHVTMYRPTFVEEMEHIADYLFKNPPTSKSSTTRMFILPHTDEQHDYLVIHYIMAPNELSTFLTYTDMKSSLAANI